MTCQDFHYSFKSSKNITDIFNRLVDPRNWWIGLFGEIIEGNSKALDDEFTFSAGDGLHFSKQRLIELVMDKKIVWRVTESNLSFLKNTNEWAGTEISFELVPNNNRTKITFTHKGLVPHFECYGGCSSAWNQYLQKLAMQLQ